MSHRSGQRLGQHFLTDTAVLQRIVDAIAPRPGQNLVEIGPGSGALSLPLLDAAGSLTAIELDQALAARLRERSAGPGQLQLIRTNVLEVNMADLAPADGGPLRVVGNLPYYLSSPILFHCLAFHAGIEDMSFLLQKEVVERVTAAPGNRTYGRLSVMVQLVCHAQKLFDVPPGAFTPPPKVDSALLYLTPRPQGEQPQVDADCLASVVRAAFGKRRKTLGNALKGILDRPQIEAAGIDPGLRAEALEPRAFVRLAEQYTRARPA